MKVDLLVHPIGELCSPAASDEPLHGSEMASIVRISDAALAVAGGKIVSAGPASQVLATASVTSETTVLSAADQVVVPGFIDPHTHLVFDGNRASEFLMRCQGKTYAEIANSGGGIVASMRATRNASTSRLVELGKKRLKRLLACGTTTCEIKTGYGLSTDSELNMLQAVLELAVEQDVEIIPTFMPAHAIPPDLSSKDYVNEVVNIMLPKAMELFQSFNAKSGKPAAKIIFNDVFCDQGYFSLAETRSILQAGKELGYMAKVHADEFVNLGASSLSVEMNAYSADHLLNISDSEVALMAESDTVAVLLPGTSFFLNLKDHARARAMLDAGVAIALGSDFNPGSCHIYSIPFIIGLACLHLKMTVAEALTAVSANAAFAIGQGSRLGQLRAGYDADFLILDISSLEELPYNLGANPVRQVFKRGKCVQKNG